MSKIWSTLIIFSITFCIVTGSGSNVLSITTKASQKAVENIMVLAGMLCFWTGVFNIVKNTRLINYLSALLKPLIKIVFKGKMDRETTESVSLNMASNLIGVGNASTAYGIEAMQNLQKENNKKEASYNESLFVLINTASIQLIPTSIISMRILYGSNNPSWVILPNLFVSIVSLFMGILALKLYRRIRRCL